MGTDIYMMAERRIKGKWYTITDKVFLGYGNSLTNCPYPFRNYNLFAILANVRNGEGFAGCFTGERFNPIEDSPKGLPKDINPHTLDGLCKGYGTTWFTLKELKDYDWTQKNKTFGFLSEKEYANSIAQGKYPASWCGWIQGDGIKIVSEAYMKKLIKGTVKHKKGIDYWCECWFPAKTYAQAAGTFYTNTMPILESLIPEGGSDEDIRIVFNFDC